jgi:hypothetical protein
LNIEVKKTTQPQISLWSVFLILILTGAASALTGATTVLTGAAPAVTGVITVLTGAACAVTGTATVQTGAAYVLLLDTK